MLSTKCIISLKGYGNLDPVVQSVASLTSSLRVISLTVLADSIYNILKFFAEKMWVALLDVFNESLTNNIVSFEQLGPDKEYAVLNSLTNPT